MSAARRHHYLPQCYLALFTDTSKKDGQFFVLEIESGRTFRTSPINVAVEQDFNRVDIEGHPPDAVENALAPFEGRAVQAIKNILATGDFPNDDDFSFIINLLCLIAVRNPKHRSSFNRAREQLLHRIGDLLVSDKRIWEHHVQKMKDSGEEFSKHVSFEDMKRFIDERNYEIDFTTESNLRVEMNATDKILPILGERTWSLILAPEDGPEFICSDHPVALDWKSRQSNPVGFGLRNTEVFFPLSRRAGFYGTFEDPLRPVVQASPGNVATMNRRVALNAVRHVYSPLESFAFWHEGEPREIYCGYNKHQDNGSPVSEQ